MLSAETFRASMVPIEVAEQKIIRLLSNIVNPDTGKRHTIEELADLFDISPSRIRNILTGEVSYFLPPDVKKEPIEQSEKAFFVGIALGRFDIGKISWAEKQYVVIGTQSKDAQKRHLLKETIGKRGHVHDFPRSVKVYLDPEAFDFMLHPAKVVDYRFLCAKSRLGPFILGLFSSRLSEKRNRITLPEPGLYPKILKAFERQYGFRLGHIEKMGEDRSPSLEIQDSQLVFSTLLGSKDVQSLPFLRTLSYPQQQ